MKALVCEMCGSRDLIKQDGVFVCQACGVKYSVEEARKMMVDGPVDVSGSVVKLDTTDELANLYQIARRAKDDNDSGIAGKTYERVLIIDPKSWEAYFYVIYFQAIDFTVAEIQNAAKRLDACEDTVLKLIKENLSDPAEQKKAAAEVAEHLIHASTRMFRAARNHYSEISEEKKKYYVKDYLDRCCATRDVLYHFGNYVIQLFGNSFGKDIAVPCWKVGIEQHRLLGPNLLRKSFNKQIIEEYASKIRRYEPHYQTPRLKWLGCYVASAVYGSYDCPQVWTLRRYRDDTLAETWHGRLFIRLYYAVSPTLVRWFGHTGWFQRFWKCTLDRMVHRLNTKGIADTPYNDRPI